MDKSVPSVLPPQFVARLWTCCVLAMASRSPIASRSRRPAELLTLFDLTIQMCISDAIRLAREQYVRRSKPANQPSLN